MNYYVRGDYIRLTVVERVGYRYHQYVVAADHPDPYTQHEKEYWLIVADDEDWDRIGTFVSKHYVDKHSPVLLHRIGES